MNDFVNHSTVYGLTDEIVRVAIYIRREHKIKLPDALIASTAISQNCTLITRNVNDFKMIADLEIINLYEI